MRRRKESGGAVVSDHPLATEAGAGALEEGGSATDAVIAMAAVLSVVRPHMCGLGGDAFGLFLDGKTGSVVGLNGSGRAGARASAELLRQGRAGTTGRAPASVVTVPGAVAAIVDAHARFGRLSLGNVLRPSIRLAREGFPVSEVLARELTDTSISFSGNRSVPYFPGGGPPSPGTSLRNAALAETLESIVDNGSGALYDGPTGEALSAFLLARGGSVTPEDLAGHRSTWTRPLTRDVLDLRLHAFPPNTQGLTLLQELEMALRVGLLDVEPDSPEHLHTLIEIKKLAFADRDRWIADPEAVRVPVSELLDPLYLDHRVKLLDPERAMDDPPPGMGGTHREEADRERGEGDTVFLTAADGEGNAVSWIQSIFSPFGSGLFHHETGIVLHDRGALFRDDPQHPNGIAPGKRPFHTLCPLLATKDGVLAFTLGTPGADGQPQTLLQVLVNHLFHDMDPQRAIDAPRFRSYRGRRLQVESRYPPTTLARLQRLGHRVEGLGAWDGVMGSVQMIQSDRGGRIRAAVADRRREARGRLL